MSLVSENIRFLRKSERLTQEQVAAKIGIKRSLLGAYEEGRADPRLSNLLQIAKFFNIAVDDLISRDLTQLSDHELQGSRRHELKVLAITVNGNGKENIEFVPFKAAAGYSVGYEDPGFIESLPRFSLPNLSNTRTYRGFEIRGDSMLPVLPGSIVVGAYLEKISDLKDGKCYIAVTKDDGIVYKRIYQSSNNRVFLVSDNHAYSPYHIEQSNIMELWEAVCVISNQIPEPPTNKEDNGEVLLNLIHELKNEIKEIKARI